MVKRLKMQKEMYQKFPNDINAQITYAVTLQQTDNQIDALNLYKKILRQ